ncbi:DNA mismatch repair protein Msh2 isoform X2 [Anabrus simplex]|uniref:DNA mismatch repair protein Msh2 isoform X2 n=1 Tax=Anabrus simplex TaxID=316456 RepID=UPI0035A26A3D
MQGSPGNLIQFGDILFSSADQIVGTSVIAVRLGGDAKSKVVGVGFVDVTERRLSVCEFPDDDYFSNLEGLIVQLGPKECLFPMGESNQEYNSMKQVIERAGVLITGRKKNEFSTSDLTLDLNKLLLFQDGQQQNAMALPEMRFTTAMASLGALIKYLELITDSSNMGQFTLTTLDLSRYVHMDTAALRALSLLPPPGATAANRLQSVLGLLDKCRTAQGHRLLAQWVKQPLKDLNLINERLDIVEALFKNGELRSVLYSEHLRRIPDFLALSKKLQRQKANMQDCYRIYQAVGHLPELVNALDSEGSSPAVRSMFVEPLRELLSDMARFQEMVETTLDMDRVEQGDFLVKPSFDEDLQEYRRIMDESENEIRKLVVNVASDLGLEPNKGLKLESNAQLGYFFRVTLKEEKVLRNKKQYEMIDTNKNGVRFRNQKLSALNSEYIQARDNYTEHQQAVVSEIIGIAAGYASTLQKLNNTLAQLDVLTSFAEVAFTAPISYIRPTIHEQGTGILELKQVRHACLERQDGVSFIANDVYFRQGDCTFHIITGPNMGGKSTYIRSVGVAVLMAQIGCFVPCEKAEISLVDAILARVGADDCQMKGMSTFMKEMVETAAILRTATSNSLVIIDELGRGTSTYEGCGIAWSIAKYLASEVKAFCLFATHFHELTQLAEEVPTVRNQHVTALTSEDCLTLLYQVKPGPCDQSFGIHVSEMARFPQNVIEYAKKKQAELEDYQGLNFDCKSADKKQIIQEGEALIAEFLKKCKGLQTENMSEEEIMKQLDDFKAEIQAKNNPYIQALLSQI